MAEMPGESFVVASAPPSLSVPPANCTSVPTVLVCDLLACAMTGARRRPRVSRHIVVAVACCSKGAMRQCTSWTNRCCAVCVCTLRKSYNFDMQRTDVNRIWRGNGKPPTPHSMAWGTHSRQVGPVWRLNSLRLQVASCSCGHAAPGRLPRTRRRCSEGSLAANVRQMHHLRSRSMLDGCRVKQSMQKSMQTDRWTCLARRLCGDLHASQDSPRANGLHVSTQRLFWTTAA